MLLGEIPNATMGNPHVDHPIPGDILYALETISLEENRMPSTSSKPTNLYNSPQSLINGGNLTLFDDPNNEYETNALNGNRDEFHFPDGKYYALAFKELSSKDRVVPKPTNPSLVKDNQTSLNHNSLNNSLCLFGVDTLELSIPPFHQSVCGAKIDSQGNVNFCEYNGAMPLNPRVQSISFTSKCSSFSN